jgi:hypothetical protein
MKRLLQFVIPALGGLLTCFPINAQMRVRAPSPIPTRVQLPQPTHVKVMPQSPNNRAIQTPTGTQGSKPVMVIPIAPDGHLPAGRWPFISVAWIDEHEVPGLGFDYPHLAAIHGGLPFNPTFQQDGIGIHNDGFGPIFFPGNPEFQGVPGLGFDYPHLAAVSGNFHFDPAFEHHELGVNDNSFVPIFWSENTGSPEFVDPSVIQQIQQEVQQQGQQQPQIIFVQQPTAVAGEQLTGRSPQGPANSANASMVPPASPTAPAPVRDVGEFIFVRREGKLLFASVFFVSGGVLHYVTPEGIRHTVPLAELDTEATRKMNEAAGTTVDLHK